MDGLLRPEGGILSCIHKSPLPEIPGFHCSNQFFSIQSNTLRINYVSEKSYKLNKGLISELREKRWDSTCLSGRLACMGQSQRGSSVEEEYTIG